MFLVAGVRKATESHHNLKILLDAIGADTFPFKVTGDFAFLLPVAGCTKGCSSSNPCPFCDAWRSKEGGTKPRWVDLETASLRFLGDQFENFSGWVAAGSRTSAAATREFKSVCGQPLLPMAQGRKATDLILQLVVPGPLHIYLSWNEIVNHAEGTCLPQLKQLFSEVANVQVHVYMGKVGNYEGPSIRKIFRHLEELKPHLMGSPEGELYYATFAAFHDVAKALFRSADLQPDWREKLHGLRSLIHQLHTSCGLPLTPKLHILTVHIEQWVALHHRSLGREGEQGGEAIHHIWLRLLETLGEPKKKEGLFYVQFILKAFLQFNSNNI
jgi:hypothetical protein